MFVKVPGVCFPKTEGNKAKRGIKLLLKHLYVSSTSRWRCKYFKTLVRNFTLQGEKEAEDEERSKMKRMRRKRMKKSVNNLSKMENRVVKV